VNGSDHPQAASATLAPESNSGSGEFSALALDYFVVHAIDPDVAASAGVSESDEALLYPYEAADGSPFTRRRPLNGDKTYQPPGLGLTLWWLAHPKDGLVLVCEGEADALAALSTMPLAGYGAATLPSLRRPEPVPCPTARRGAKRGRHRRSHSRVRW
jgi:hypothetical protein